MSRFNIIKGRLLVQQLYQCANCPRTGAGSTVSIDINTSSVIDIVTGLNGIQPTAANMPLYWCHDVDNKFKCPSCYAGAAKVVEA